MFVQIFSILLPSLIITLKSDIVQGLCTEGAVRYDPKYNISAGLVQICVANQWGYICANNEENSRKEVADVVCRQMGYTSRLESGI